MLRIFWFSSFWKQVKFVTFDEEWFCLQTFETDDIFLPIIYESRIIWIYCREQRVTGISVYILLGVSVPLASVLKYVPFPVLYGVFMHMGVITLTELQFIDRLIKIVLPCRKQPDYAFLRHVPVWKVRNLKEINLSWYVYKGSFIHCYPTTCFGGSLYIKENTSSVPFPSHGQSDLTK